MKVDKKIFPYPILNHIKQLSNYGNCVFDIPFIKEETNTEIKLRNLQFVTNSNYLNSLYDDELIDVACIIECSDTVYRKNLKIGRENKEITLSKGDFIGTVYITFFAYATKDFQMESDEFEEDYRGIPFPIDKYDIIAACDNKYFKIRHNKKESELSKSIFSVVNDHTKNDGQYSTNIDTNKITIYLSDEDYNNYKVISDIEEYKEEFFNILLIPTLSYGLMECQKKAYNVSSIEEITDTYPWLWSVIKAYKRLHNNDMTLDALKDAKVIELAQELLGKPLNASFKRIVERNTRIAEEG